MQQHPNITNNNELLKQNPFQVPEDYFETCRIRLEEKILSSSSNPFTIPEDYFETNKIKLYNTLSSNNNPFSVPENYFNTTKQKLYNTIINQPPSHRKNNIIPIFRYIAAAAVVGGIVWGIHLMYQLSNNSPLSTPTNNCKTIACLTKKDILSREILDDELLQETISDEQIEKHFNTNSNKNFPDTNTYSTSELNEVF